MQTVNIRTASTVGLLWKPASDIFVYIAYIKHKWPMHSVSSGHCTAIVMVGSLA